MGEITIIVMLYFGCRLGWILWKEKQEADEAETRNILNRAREQDFRALSDLSEKQGHGGN
jgi:hypothetical protein